MMMVNILDLKVDLHGQKSFVMRYIHLYRTVQDRHYRIVRSL